MMELSSAFRDYTKASKQQRIHEHTNHYAGKDTENSANSINIPDGQALFVQARY